MKTNQFEAYVRDNFGTDNNRLGGIETLAVAGLGLAGEAGEATEHVKKYIRDDKPLIGNEAFKLELGDVLHYLTYLAQWAGWSLEEVMDANVEKLDKRHGR